MSLESDAERIKRQAEEANNVPVRIALFGQPGAGKSSLINAIVGQDVAPVGIHTDTTQEAHDYEWNGLALCDLPGYGTAKFPVASYFEDFDVLSYDAFICVSSNKFLGSDVGFFNKLRDAKKPCIFVRNQCDAMHQRGKSDEQLRQEVTDDLQKLTGHNERVIFTSCRTGAGLDELVLAIQESLTGLKRDRFIRSAKAYSTAFLDRKREACRNYALLAAGSAAAVNAVPVPGLGFAADISAVAGLLTAINKDFGIDDKYLELAERLYPALGPTISELVRTVGRQGAIWALERIAGRVAAAEATKWVPLLGPIIAASISFLTIRYLAFVHIDACYKVAQQMLDAEFQ